MVDVNKTALLTGGVILQSLLGDYGIDFLPDLGYFPTRV